MKCELKKLTTTSLDDTNNKSDESDDNDSDDTCGGADTIKLQHNSNNISSSNYPLLAAPSMHIPVEKLTPGEIKTMIGKLVKAQNAAKQNESTVIEFSKWQSDDIAIIIPRHKSDDAFIRYHYRKPYFKELINVMGKRNAAKADSDPKVGATRMLSYLAREFGKEYVDMAKSHNLSLHGMLDAVSLAGMQHDARLKDWQAKRIVKHFSHALDCKVSVPFSKLKQFSDGVIHPKTKTIQHEHNDGTMEKITCDYQNVADMYKQLVAEILMENNAKYSDVISADFCLGGDHGVGAFRLCFRSTVKLARGEIFHNDVGVATVKCKKDTSAVLEATIMDWLMEDLKTINESMLVITDACDGEITCDYEEKALQHLQLDSNSFVLPEINIYITDDIKWLVMLLGMEDMAIHWCVHCLLHKEIWATAGHGRGTDRTIENIVAMANNPKTKGAAREGVKRKPYWDFIPVSNYETPLLHIWMGIFNNIDNHFMAKIDQKLLLCHQMKTTYGGSLF